ncbi:amylo-alpha-1,6-glucosidase [Cohnella hongkongensis]|uniref:Amylo-alpha-1,6-glucosidase n=1 Tax=Cohnella hongkongensis TaxID=178337 RepID=A0ABV9FI19_9BACL
MGALFDLQQVPFSRYGSYMAISQLNAGGDDPEGVYLRTVHGATKSSRLFRIELIATGGETLPFFLEPAPAKLRLVASGGAAEFVFAEPDVLRIRVQGDVGIRFIMDRPQFYDNIQPYGDGGRWELNGFSQSRKFMLTPLSGKLHIDAPWEAMKCTHIVVELFPGEGLAGELALEEFATVWRPRDYAISFDACYRSVQSDFDEWMAKTLPVSIGWEQSRTLAAYVNWSAVVRPEGHIKRPAMLMSKNRMTNIWSWDHCFNAMALAQLHPDAAWEQFVFMFDYQDDCGALPDSVNDRTIIWNFCKPPIHGWALQWMRKRNGHAFGAERLATVYEPLARWTEWWFRYRDGDGDGIPQYNHGNDCGWDNSTVFHDGAPVESPDLCAFLILQMEALADIAGEIGRPMAETQLWRERADKLLADMLAHSWRSDHFVAPRSADHHVVQDADSLLPFMTLVLGNRLPEDVRAKLVAGLCAKGRFLTEHGLATESISSAFYKPDGYWRGPIWAPPTLIVADGLASMGETELSRDIATRFCRLIAHSGMAENFNATTGEGLRDRAYTWTSSVFLILAHEYVS